MPRREGYKKRSALEKAADETLIVKLHLEKYSGLEITEILQKDYGREISESTVQKTLRAKAIEWGKRNQEFINESLMQQIEVLNHVENQAWQGWYRSMEDAEKTVVRKRVLKAIEKGAKPQTETVTIKEIIGQAGDPRFLTVITRASDTKAKMLDQLKLKADGMVFLEKLAKAMGIDITTGTAPQGAADEEWVEDEEEEV